MHRKHIRATVGPSDVDIPTGVFVDQQFLRFLGGQIVTAWAIPGINSSTDNAITRWDGTSGHFVQDSQVTIDDAGNISTPGTINGTLPNRWVTYTNAAAPFAREIPVFSTGTTNPADIVFGNGPWIEEDGAMTHITTLNGRAPETWVDGPSPAASTDNAIARWDGVGGRLIQNSTVIIDDSGNITGVGTVNNVPPGDWVRGPSPATATDNAIVRWDNSGIDGRLVQNSLVTIDDSGNVSGVVSLVGFGITTYVKGDSSGTDNAIARYDTSVAYLKIQPSLVTIDDSGNITTPGNLTGGSVGGVPVGVLVRSSGVSHTQNAVALWDPATGTHAQKDSVVIISDSGSISGAINFNGNITISRIIAYTTSRGNPFVNEMACFDVSSFPLTVSYRPVTVDDSGNFGGMGTLNGRTIARWVDGPVSGASTNNGLALWDGTNGRLLKDGGVNSPTVDTSTGLITTPVGVLVHSNTGNIHTDNAVVRWDGTGSHTQDSTVIIDDSGNITGAGTLNGRTIANWVESTSLFPTSGRILVVAADNTRQIQPTGVTVTDFVTASANFAVDNRVLRSDGTTKAAQASAVTLDDSANFTGVNKINGLRVGHIANRIVGGTTPVSYVLDTTGTTTDINVYFFIPYSVGGSANLTVSLLASSGFNQGHVMCGAQGGIITTNGGVVSLLTTGATAIPSLGFVTIVSSLTGYSAGATLTATIGGTAHNGGTAQILAVAT